VFLGSGHCDVEEAEFFAHCLAENALLDECGSEGGITDEAILIDDGDAETDFSIDEDGAVGVGEIVVFAEVGEEDDGEFEALGAVDAHDADDLFALADGGGAADFFLFLKVFEKSEKAMKALAKEGAELAGAFVEMEEIGDALLAVFEAAAVGEISGFFIEPPEQFGDRAFIGLVSPLAEMV
jgi:hypothetical protein